MTQVTTFTVYDYAGNHYNDGPGKVLSEWKLYNGSDHKIDVMCKSLLERFRPHHIDVTIDYTEEIIR